MPLKIHSDFDIGCRFERAAETREAGGTSISAWVCSACFLFGLLLRRFFFPMVANGDDAVSISRSIHKIYGYAIFASELAFRVIADGDVFCDVF